MTEAAGAPDWQAIWVKLMHGIKRPYTPWEIRQLTFPELAIALNDADLDKPRPPDGGTPTGGNSASYRQWLQSLTVRQRLELARDGRVTSEG